MKMLRLVSFYPEKGILHLFFHENSYNRLAIFHVNEHTTSF